MDKEGIIPQEKSNRKNNSNSDKSKYLRVVPGDIAYNTMRMWEGRSAYVGLEGLVSPAYTVCQPKAEVHSLLFSYYFKTPQLIEQFRRYSQGLVKDTLNLKYEAFSKIAVLTPKYVEQQKIADCFSSVDELIAAQARKLDALKIHRNGLMQQLFPREGETLPRLRFPEFQNEPEWKKKKLSDLLFETKQRNRALKYGPNEVLSVSGEFGCVNQIELLGRSYAGVSVKDYHIVEMDDVVYTKSPLKRNPYGIIKANKGKPGIVSTLYAVYRTTDLALPDYLDHYFSRDYNLNSYLQPIVRKGAKNDMKVNNTDVLSGEIWVPKRNEQQKISACLTSLDELIAAHSHKFDALKTHKNGLMQHLFPSLVEVEA
jgi:type I restriction enzyme S subunit